MTSFQVETIRTIDDLLPLVDPWRDLSEGIPFRQPEWILPWVESFLPADAELHVVVVKDDENQLRALLPTYYHTRDKSLRLLGDGKVCSDYVGLMVDDQTQDINLASNIVQHLVAHHPDVAPWRRLCLEAVDQSNRHMQVLRTEFDKVGAKTIENQPANTWVVDLEGGWTHFLTSVSKNSRKAFRKRSEELEKVRVRWVNDRADLEEYFPILVDLHQKRREMVGDPGCFSDPRFASFLMSTAQRLLERGQLQAFTLWLDNKPISADLGYRSKDRWFCYQAGIDPLAMEHEPGKLANIYMLKSAERFGIRHVDFLRGDEPYKQQLKANPKPLANWTITRPGLSGRADHMWLGAKERVKQAVKGITQRKKSS
jgi:CelD/BcsL family acetyltransferase involved in cellulose biosynthesis